MLSLLLLPASPLRTPFIFLILANIWCDTCRQREKPLREALYGSKQDLADAEQRLKQLEGDIGYGESSVERHRQEGAHLPG